MRIIKEHDSGLCLELENGTFIKSLGDGRYLDDEMDEEYGVIGSIALPYEGECDESGHYTDKGKNCYCNVAELIREAVQAIAAHCPEDMDESEFCELVGTEAEDIARTTYCELPSLMEDCREARA